VRLLLKVRKQLPPYSPISVLINHIQSLYNLPDLFYLDLWPLGPSFLITSHTALANKFLDDYIRHPIALKKGLQPLVGGDRGLISDDSSEWHNTRTLIRSVFSVTNVQRFVPDMAKYTMQLRAVLLHHATTGRRFPIVDPIEKWGADLTFRFLTGEDSAVQLGGWGADANAHVQALISHFDGQVSLNLWANRERKRKREFHLGRLREMILRMVNEALKRGQPVKDNQFLSLMDSLAAKYHEEHPGQISWDSDTLIQHLDTVSTMFLAADVSSMILTVASLSTSFLPSFSELLVSVSLSFAFLSFPPIFWAVILPSCLVPLVPPLAANHISRNQLVHILPSCTRFEGSRRAAEGTQYSLSRRHTNHIRDHLSEPWQDQGATLYNSSDQGKYETSPARRVIDHCTEGVSWPLTPD
jgi:hypothetical protein